MRRNVIPLWIALHAIVGSSAFSQSAPVVPLTSTATTAPVQGFGPFQFGDTLQKVRARLEGSFPGQTCVFDREFGRVSLRLHRGIQLNSQDAQALFTFVDGRLADVLLELDPRSTDKQTLLSYLRQRFGVAGKTAPSAAELQFGRPVLTTFAGGSVVVEDSVALSGSDYLGVHFQDFRVMRDVQVRLEKAVQRSRLKVIFEQRGWLELPHEPISGLDDFLKALVNADTLEQFALLGEKTTRERAWAGSYFYANQIYALEGEERGMETMRISAEQFRNPLAAFLMGRLAYTNATYDDTSDPKTAQKTAQTAYMTMLNALKLTSRFQERLPQLSQVLTNSHTAMISGLAIGAGDLTADQQEMVDASWREFWSTFKKLYQVDLPEE